jgi:hypothetical protein
MPAWDEEEEEEKVKTEKDKDGRTQPRLKDQNRINQ